MVETFNFDTNKIKSVIRSNNAIKKTTQTYVKEFLTIQAEFLGKINEIYGRLDTIEHVANIFLDDDKKDVLNQYQPSENVQLAVCGYNNSGKTSFIHELLGLGDFLPAGEGAVTARIVKFSYAPPDATCIVQYSSVSDHTEIGDKIPLSSLFTTNMTEKVRKNKLKKLIKEHLARPSDIDQSSDAFTTWAKSFIEIRIPSPILELGLDIYDTPGFLASDPPILRDNLLKLVHDVSPTLVFLYDNATVSDDSRKCYEKLKEALRSQMLGVDIFFLNTKADVAVIRKNASHNDDNSDDDDDDEDDDEELLKKERRYRLKLLLNANEMKGDINNDDESGQPLSLEQCKCFDIFTTLSPTDSMGKMMKHQAIDRIIHYTAEHDLRVTKAVIRIIHEAIDTFFDFILVTNRRSPEEWKILRDEALQWGDEFFKQYRDTVDQIATEANRRLPQRFQEKVDDIKKRVLEDCEKGGLQVADQSHVQNLRRHFQLSSVALDLARHAFLEAKNLRRSHWYAEKNFVDMLVEREVMRPTIQQIISERSEHIKQAMDKKLFICYRSKNELLYAAYREGLAYTGNLSDLKFISIGEMMQCIIASLGLIVLLPVWGALDLVFYLTGGLNHHSLRDELLRRKQFVLDYLTRFQEILSTMGSQLKIKMDEWIDSEHKKFSKKVDGYFKVVCRTVEHRHRAYELARLFAPHFARIECRLEANLNLAAHNGSQPVIDKQVVLGAGGFFTVHPAAWNDEKDLVAKKLRDPSMNQDFAYLEAHFHRTVTSLNIPHMVHLKYLYEEHDSSFYLLLPRYETDLHSFLVTHMKKMTADKAIQIIHDIATVIAHMHAHDLVHRDIKVPNILLDKQEQVYLADFGTCQHGTENNTFIGTGSRPIAPDLIRMSSSTGTDSSSSRHQDSYQGKAVDVYLLGMLMYACAPKNTYIPPSDSTLEQLHSLDRRKVPEQYCQLIARCLNQDPKQRPTAKEIVDELNTIAKHLCIICEEAPRFARFEPCGHNIVCAECVSRLQEKNAQPQCIMCKQIIINIRDDTNANTFISR